MMAEILPPNFYWESRFEAEPLQTIGILPVSYVCRFSCLENKKAKSADRTYRNWQFLTIVEITTMRNHARMSAV